METKEGLKPCPFCGNDKPVMMTRRGQVGWRDYFYVLCDYNDGGCGASGQWNHYADIATESWNKRAKQFTPDDVMTALVIYGQTDKQFRIGETIRYSPSEVQHILERS